jgi:hypothetical protein
VFLVGVIGVVPALFASAPRLLVALSVAPAIVLALALTARAARLLPLVVFALGLGYGIALFVPHGKLGLLAPVYGAALLLCAELAYWSLSPTADAWGEHAVVLRRLQGIATLLLAALVVDVLLMATAGTHPPGGVVLFALGFAAAAGVLLAVAVLARREARL